MSTMSAIFPVEAVGGPRIFYDGAQERKIFGRSRETDWALGGAAIGFTAALVEFIANNVLDKSDQFSSRKGEIRPVSRKTKGRRKFKDILDEVDDFDRSNAFGYDDYDISYRNLLQEHYIDNDDVYDYQDYSYSQFFQTTFPPKKFDLKYDLKKLNRKQESTTRSPWKRRKSVTTTRKPRRRQKQRVKSSTSSPISIDIPRAESLPDSIQKNLLSDAYTLANIRKPKVINKTSTVKKAKDSLQRRYFDQREPAQADLLRRVTTEYENQRKKEKQQAMFNRIMAYTSQNYNKRTKKFESPINAYVGIPG